MNECLLEDGQRFQAIVTMFHEGTHSILSQLVYAAGNGILGPEHPLYGDIRRRAACKFEGAFDNNLTASVYFNEPEEKLIMDQQDRFIWELYTDTSLRSKFHFHAHNAAKYFDKEMPVVAKIIRHFVPV